LSSAFVAAVARNECTQGPSIFVVTRVSGAYYADNVLEDGEKSKTPCTSTGRLH